MLKSIITVLQGVDFAAIGAVAIAGLNLVLNHSKSAKLKRYAENAKHAIQAAEQTLGLDKDVNQDKKNLAIELFKSNLGILEKLFLKSDEAEKLIESAVYEKKANAPAPVPANGMSTNIVDETIPTEAEEIIDTVSENTNAVTDTVPTVTTGTEEVRQALLEMAKKLETVDTSQVKTNQTVNM